MSSGIKLYPRTNQASHSYIRNSMLSWFHHEIATKKLSVVPGTSLQRSLSAFPFPVTFVVNSSMSLPVITGHDMSASVRSLHPVYGQSKSISYERVSDEFLGEMKLSSIKLASTLRGCVEVAHQYLHVMWLLPYIIPVS